jgi:pimeloyl-ACP methyl ester carboxylesterase
MSYLSANGVKFHVQRLGKGGDRTVVFLHGLVMDNLSSWYFTVANPVAKMADVVLYDLRGHGLTERPRTGYTCEQSVADLKALLDALQIHHPVYLAGNSYGGMVSIAFAGAYPERVAGLMLVEAHYPVEGWGEAVADTLESATAWAYDPRVLAWFEEHKMRHHDRRKKSADDFLENTSLIEDLKNERAFRDEDLRKIDVPTLALYGERSDIIDRGHALGRLLPHCDLRIMGDCAHTILMDRSAEVRDHLIDWLQKQPPHWRQA